MLYDDNTLPERMNLIIKNHSGQERSVDNILVSALLNVVPLLGWQRLGLHLSDPSSPGGGEVLEHALAVSAQHPLQAAGHRVGPEEVVVQRRVRVDPLAGVQGEQLVYQVTGVGVLVITNISNQS